MGYTVAGLDTQPWEGYFVDRLVHIQRVSVSLTVVPFE